MWNDDGFYTPGLGWIALRYISYLALALVVVAIVGTCLQRVFPPKVPESVSPAGIRSGDLLFIGIPADYCGDNASMSSAIAEATSDSTSAVNFIHTAILDVDSTGTVWVIDATIAHGVDRHPLDTAFADFALKDGRRAVFEVMRFENTKGAKWAAEHAYGYLGEEYDLHFLPGNGKHYCTELVYDVYITFDGEHVFEQVPMNFLDPDGNMPAYWEKLFSRLGRPVPQGQPGTNPNQLHSHPHLQHAKYL